VKKYEYACKLNDVYISNCSLFKFSVYGKFVYG